ncbi:DEAD/DEAH box helicase, partial [Arcobacteraceae bacterium]|nr:DEAD/DEAH box helicase [Arcobacteraceae bacterium]
MFFYEVALLNSPLEPLTYQSEERINIGSLVEVSLQKRAKLLNGVIVKEVEKPTFKCVTISNITKNFYSSLMLETSQFISTYYVCSLGEALSIYTPFYDVEKTQEQEKIQSDIVLSDEQEKALTFTKKNKTSLLFANTGSGKTEIYIKAIEDVIADGSQSLMLIPEISLSVQMEQRLKKVFKDKIAIWHSKIQKKTKEKII